jgi:hypothetical protein
MDVSPRGPLLALVSLLVAGVGLAVACSSDPVPARPTAPEAGAAVVVDAGAGAAPACVKSPVAASFPTGACKVPLPPAKDTLDEALAVIGRDRCTTRLDLANVAVGLMNPKDPRTMPDFTALLEYPLRIPGWGAETAKWLDDAVASDMPVSRAIAAAATRVGAPVLDCPDPDLFLVAREDQAPLATALYLSAPEAIDPDVAGPLVVGIPLELQRALAPIVRAIAWAAKEVVAARGSADPTALKNAPDFALGVAKLGLTKDRLAAIDSFDLARTHRAALVVAQAVEAGKLGRFRGVDIPKLDLRMPWGDVILRGTGNDRYEPGTPADYAALVVDTGGDDVYQAAVGAAIATRPVSVAIDLGGKDTWGYAEKPIPADNAGMRLPSDAAGRGGDNRTRSTIGRQGSGRFGVGLVWDLGPDGDRYRSLVHSQGLGVFGVGVLFDEGGDDTYEAEAMSQGAAAWGIGLLLDRAGSDVHKGYSAMQGYAFTRGFGAVVDLAGDDEYTTDVGDPAFGGDPLYPSAQLPGRGNTAMSQGCGRGNRPDVPEPGYQMPGGIGLLRDAHGNDRYKTSVFGQGSSFGLGIGVLSDGDGDDVYEGLWYVQGANAHTGVCYFYEGAGDDRYNPTYPVAATMIGVGHDFSAAVHLDLGGSDAYRAGGLAIGAGNANGLGLLANIGGDDSYESNPQMTLGAANVSETMGFNGRGVMPTIGVFVRAGGVTTFKKPPTGAVPGGTWGNIANPDAGTAESAVGVDRPAGTAVFP